MTERPPDYEITPPPAAPKEEEEKPRRKVMPPATWEMITKIARWLYQQQEEKGEQQA